MKKLLLALTILTSTKSLHSMEIPSPNTDYSKLSPITLPQIYHHLSEILLPDIAFHIFSLQPGTSTINCTVPFLKKETTPFENKEKAKITLYGVAKTYAFIADTAGHCLTVEILKRRFLREKMSICDITDDSNLTLLHDIASYEHTTKYAKICLEVAGNKMLSLLTAQEEHNNQTALHIAAEKGHVNFVKLLLDTAGERARDLIAIQDSQGYTTFDIATPEAKEVMLPYFQNNQ